MDEPSGTTSQPAESAPEPSGGGGTDADRAARWRGLAGNGVSPSAETAESSDLDAEASHGPEAAVAGEPSAEDPAPAADGADVEAEEESARAFLAGGAFATVAVERYDDLPAIFGKVDAAASPRVALVAARGNRELQRALSMRRLQRHLDLTGKDLILVTRSRALRLRARQEGLPAVGSLHHVDFHSDRRPGLHLGPLTLPLSALGILLAAVLLVGALGAGAAFLFWYLPEADVTVFLPVTPVEDTFDLVLDGQTTEVNLATGTVPARRREVVVTRSFYRPATGVIQIPIANAAVALRFTNRTNTPVVVPQGTVVIANNGVRFTVAGDVNLPRLNAAGDVLALSQQSGAAGNVPANSIVRVEGDLASRVAVTNPAPGEKGADTPQQVVSEGDVEGVRAFADPVLIDAATQELLQRFAETATVFGGSASVEIIEINPTTAVNLPAKYVDVRVTGRVSLLTVEDTDLRRVYAERFRPVIPPGSMLLEEGFTTAVVGAGELERATDRLPVTVHVGAVTSPYLDRATLQDTLAGKSKKGVEQAMRGIVDSPLPPLVKISPGWAPRLPRKADRIHITFAAAP
ncbi:MAG: baseplate J/gp47 family protein [Dehalococcoidia bacterium]